MSEAPFSTLALQLTLLYVAFCAVYVCCLTLVHVLSGPTEPPHPTSPITQSPHPPFHKGTSTPHAPSYLPNSLSINQYCKNGPSLQKRKSQNVVEKRGNWLLKYNTKFYFMSLTF